MFAALAVAVNVLVGRGDRVTDAVEVGVLLGVLEGCEVALGRGVFVGVKDDVGVVVDVLDGRYVEVMVAVDVIVGGSPVKVKDSEVFNSEPMKMRTSYVPGNHLSADCLHTE